MDKQRRLVEETEALGAIEIVSTSDQQATGQDVTIFAARRLCGW